MIKKASAPLRNGHTEISEMAKRTKEPIYITKNDENDLDVMNNDASERQNQILQLRAKVLQGEQERMEGAETLRISEARQRLTVLQHRFASTGSLVD